MAETDGPDALEFAALMCSRVCHDVISPVGAIVNGLEIVEEEDDEEMREQALLLIAKSALQASAKLQFARLAFGASGSAGAHIELSDAHRAAEALLEGGRITLRWDAKPAALHKTRMKLLMNMLQFATMAIPRGGELAVHVETELGDLEISATGDRSRIPEHSELATGANAPEALDGRSVQPYLMNLLAKSLGCHIEIGQTDEKVQFSAKFPPSSDAAA